MADAALVLLNTPQAQPLLAGEKNLFTPAGHNPFFFTDATAQALQDMLKHPHQLFLQVGEQKSLDTSLSSLLIHNPHFALCMRTQSAYHLPIAQAISYTLNERFGLQGHKSMQIETCLHEALINAIIHGNLDIDSSFSTAEGFDSYHALVEKRLTSDPYQDRRIRIAAWDYDTYLKIAVTDQGKGYSLCQAHVQTQQCPHGRGLVLIESLADRLWVDESLRTTFMTFNHK